MDNLDEFTEARIIDEIKNFSDADLEDVLMNLTPTERNILCLRHDIKTKQRLWHTSPKSLSRLRRASRSSKTRQ